MDETTGTPQEPQGPLGGQPPAQQPAPSVAPRSPAGEPAQEPLKLRYQKTVKIRITSRTIVVAALVLLLFACILASWAMTRPQTPRATAPRSINGN